jgi:hypothetical protein
MTSSAPLASALDYRFGKTRLTFAEQGAKSP